jgi:hypothetical protein
MRVITIHCNGNTLTSVMEIDPVSAGTGILVPRNPIFVLGFTLWDMQ